MNPDLSIFLEKIVLTLRQAGNVARSLQNKAQNEKKSAESFFDDTDSLKARREAKTVVDEIVQEIILKASESILDTGNTVLDAEEETISKSMFSQGSSDLTLIIDPIDGTMEYLNGLNSYSICVGLVRKSTVISATVYFPARDRLYFLDVSGTACFAEDVYCSGLKKSKPLVSSSRASKVIYKNSRVEFEVIERLKRKGYEVLDDTYDKIGCADAILKCLSGEATAYLSHTRQTRDVLLGAILSQCKKGYALDWKGERLVWPQAGGRIPRAIFGVGDYPEDVLGCLLDTSEHKIPIKK